MWAQITDSVFYDCFSQMQSMLSVPLTLAVSEQGLSSLVSLQHDHRSDTDWPQVSKAFISLITAQSLLKTLISMNEESLVDKIAQNAFRELLFHMVFVPQMHWFSCINKHCTHTASTAYPKLWPFESISLLIKVHA